MLIMKILLFYMLLNFVIIFICYVVDSCEALLYMHYFVILYLRSELDNYISVIRHDVLDSFYRHLCI